MSSSITTTTSKVTGAVYLDGLASGIDTTSMLEELADIRRKPIDTLETKKAGLQAKLAVYQTISASLANLKLAAQDIASVADFRTNTATVSGYTSAAAPMAVAADNTAEAGAYSLTVEQLAGAQKVRSGSVATSTEALGLSGSVLINGKAITLEADDTLTTLSQAINDAGAGVTATVIKVANGDFRLTLSADQTGAANAIDLVDASASGVLTTLGLTSATTTTKHAVTDGVRSDAVPNSALEVAQSLGLVVPPAGTVLINGQAVAMDLGSDSLEDLRDRINATVGIGATASIISEEVDGVQSFSLQITGESGVPTLQDDGGVLRALGFLTQAPANQVQAAADATITVDGLTVTRSTNSMDDVIAGVSIELTTASPGQAFTLSVAPDTSDVVDRVQAFVDAYNNVVNRINAASAYDTEAASGGTLFGDNTTLNLEHGLRSAVMGAIGLSTGSSTLAALGISSGDDDTLILSADTLSEALADDPDAVASLFGLNVSTSDSGVEFVSSTALTAESGPDGFAISITQAATRAAATSADLSGGITRDETLTFGGKYSVTLTAGMSLQEAADTLNGWFNTNSSPYQATVADGRLSITHEQYGSRYKIAIASSLADGSGGTDLGAAVAGQAETYAGQDVAGTINGEAATGSGQFLTGADGNANTAGLKLKITAGTTGSLGRVNLVEGAARRLADYLDLALDATNGSMTRGAASINKGIEAIDEDIASIEEDVQAYTDKMRLKFTAMETAIANAQTLMDYITGQLSALDNNSQ